MSFWQQHKSPLGYVSNGNKIDTYGVDHSAFTTRDELQYQNARINRENNLMTQMQNQGITDYPQYTTNFWGTNADNNYGFGSSNIGSNIESMKQNITTTPQVMPQYWETAADGKQVYDNVIKIEGNYKPQNQNLIDYTASAIKGGTNLISNFSTLKKANYTDKYKHALMNCKAAQYGQGGADSAKLASNIRELGDIVMGSNTLDSSQGDQYANLIGRLLGSKYPQGDCDVLVQKYIKKNW